MRKILLFTLVFVCVFTLQSFDLFRYPTGVWKCEELSITLDFDAKSKYNGIGEILIDGIPFEIVSSLYVGGELGISFSDDIYDANNIRTDWLFWGSLKWKGRTTIEYTVKIEGFPEEVYTFVKVDDRITGEDFFRLFSIIGVSGLVAIPLLSIISLIFLIIGRIFKKAEKFMNRLAYISLIIMGVLFISYLLFIFFYYAKTIFFDFS